MRSYPLLAALISTLLLAAAGCGAGSRAAQDQSFTIHTYARELVGKPENPRQMTEEEIAGLPDLAAGKQDLVARLVLEDGAWRREGWYPYAEAAVALAWCRREVPLTMAASEDTLAALRRIAREGKLRSARVRAAACLRLTDGDLARQVLRAEYARFDAAEGAGGPLSPYTGPVSAAESLAALGVYLPPEMPSAEEMAMILTVQDRQTFDPNRLRIAADLFNRRLLEAAGDKNPSALDEYATSLGRIRLARLCWEEARTAVSPATSPASAPAETPPPAEQPPGRPDAPSAR